MDSIRIGGVVIPNHKRVEYALQSIHGIGRARVRQILSELSLENKLTKDLSKEEIITLREGIAKYMIETDLRRECGGREIDWKGLDATGASGTRMLSRYVAREQRPMAGLARKRGLEFPTSRP
ncbi:30S ribosomal protein S13, chloroplastic-like [Triticum dicoccoides]|uniref:30S ribosomal protein S13, chloroplastic-like n=1 Tax=Triticum dicoccoides TaxID=85692 RepID=UPI001891B4DA|nr:30S ribosomal protein S13, chloroplastic-like [Triticum dicoccoides]